MSADKIFNLSFTLNATTGNNFAKAFGNASNKLSKLSEAMAQQKTQQQELQAKYNQASEVLQKYSTRMQMLQTAYQNGALSSRQYDIALRQLSPHYNSVKLKADAYSLSLKQLGMQSQKTAAEHKRMSASLQAQQGLGSSVGGLKSKALSGYAAFTIASDMATSFLEPAVQFEAGMSKVKAITGATGTEMEKLSELAQELGKTTMFSATQAADAMSYLGMAGWKTEEIAKGMPGLLDLAAASGSDLATVADIISDDLTAFGMSADEAGRMADVFAAASSNANTNVEMMGQTFKYAGALAGSLGYDLEDVAIATGLMGNASIKADQAGTSLRQIMTRLIDRTGEAGTVMDELRISVKNEDGTMKPFMQTMEELRDAFSGLSESEKAEKASALAGQTAMSGFLAIVNASEKDLKKLSNAVTNSKGAAKRMADTMQDNTQGAMTALKSATESVSISLGSIFLPKLAELAKVLAEGAKGLADFCKEHSTAISILGDAALTIGTVVAAYKLWQGATVMATAAQWALNVALNANPIGLVVIAIGALCFAAYELYKHCDVVREGWDRMCDNMYNGFARVANFVIDKYNAIAEVLGTPIVTHFNARVINSDAGDADSYAIGSNASGGIYGKGAFLTTFAEDSGESAIPHDPTSRNIGLLAKTNEIMGNPLNVGGGEGTITATFAPNITINGNADENVIKKAVEDEMENFKAMMMNFMRQERRQSFA